MTSPSFRDMVLERVTIHKFRAGNPVYRLDDPAGGLWGILNGSVEAEMPGSSGPLLGHFGAPGFWFGEGTVIMSTARRIGVFATRPSILAHLSIADCHSILAKDPLGWRWIALLSTINTDIALLLAADLLVRDPARRTSAMLLRLAGLRNGKFLPSSQVPINLSHAKLGQLTNLSRNAIGTILKSFEDEGYIAVKYRSIEVKDAARLLALLADEKSEP